MSRLNIKPLSGCIGAEIHGIDLTKPITHELYLQLRGCLVEHEVIFFRDQDITTEEHLRFGKYFGCMNDNCGTTRALQRNGEPKPIVMEPISTSIACSKFEDIYLLRDSMKGLFLAASKYPKNRETRAPKVSEINNLKDEFSYSCRFLPDKDKHLYLLNAPVKDKDGNPYVIRYNRTDDIHYVASEKDGKKTKWTASFNKGAVSYTHLTLPTIYSV